MNWEFPRQFFQKLNNMTSDLQEQHWLDFFNSILDVELEEVEVESVEATFLICLQVPLLVDLSFLFCDAVFLFSFLSMSFFCCFSRSAMSVVSCRAS